MTGETAEVDKVAVLLKMIEQQEEIIRLQRELRRQKGGD